MHTTKTTVHLPPLAASPRPSIVLPTFCFSAGFKAGVVGPKPEVLRTLLHGRTFTLKVGNARSQPTPVAAVVPQGSVWDALLYNIHQ